MPTAAFDAGIGVSLGASVATGAMNLTVDTSEWVRYKTVGASVDRC